MEKRSRNGFVTRRDEHGRYIPTPVAEWILPDAEEWTRLISKKVPLIDDIYNRPPPRYPLWRRVRDAYRRALRRWRERIYKALHCRAILREKLAAERGLREGFERQVRQFEAERPLLHHFYRAWCRAEKVPWDGADGVDPTLHSKELREFSEFLRYTQDCDTPHVYPHVENPAPKAHWSMR